MLPAPLQNTERPDSAGSRSLTCQRVEEIRTKLKIGVTTVRGGKGLPLDMLDKPCPYQSTLFKAIQKRIVKDRTLPPQYHWLLLTAVIDGKEISPLVSGDKKTQVMVEGLCRAVHEHLEKTPADVQFFRQWTFKTSIDTTAKLWFETSCVNDLPQGLQPRQRRVAPVRTRNRPARVATITGIDQEVPQSPSIQFTWPDPEPPKSAFCSWGSPDVMLPQMAKENASFVEPKGFDSTSWRSDLEICFD